MLDPFGSSLMSLIDSCKSPLLSEFYEKSRLCYNHKGQEIFQKTNFESSWAFEGLKICKIMYFVLPFWFLASTFLVPTPLKGR